MIPYDDLVAALASWRTRQGLPTGQISGGSGPTPAAPAPPKPAPPGPGLATRPTPPPAAAARPPSGARPAAMIVEPAHEATVDVDEAALLEEASFDSDFAMSFGSGGETAEATAIGAPPAPPRRGGR